MRLRPPSKPRPHPGEQTKNITKRRTERGGAGRTGKHTSAATLPPPRDPGGAASEPHSTPLYNPPGAHIEGGYRAIGEEVYTSNGKTENLL